MSFVFHFVPWYVWVGAIAILILITVAGMWPVIFTVLGSIRKAWVALPTDVKLAACVIVGMAGLVVFHFWDVRMKVNAAVAEAQATCNQVWKKQLAAQEQAAEAKARANEAAHAAELETIQKQAQQEVKDAKDQRDKDVAAAHAGALVLRFIPDRGSGGLIVPNVASGTAGSDGAAPAELPRSVTADLYALADDADAIARQLASCQSVVVSDRATTR